ncbi:actin-like ATPase domain-containing protein [Parathielavia appendiculata]|uniref:Actin-like ATPase domain-containing protein n=1 Tax=Parathielavia appendiculata TaxID=2587402 RepID=A0AAN6U436_9PEZI|nr:actin-like ATPase domain-containing protein [Parathielavia appendiculata]
MGSPALDEFLQPLAIDTQKVLQLSRELASTFRKLSFESLEQFLPTPISESILRPASRDHGRLFSWIGERVAEVVRKGCDPLRISRHDELPMGVTFSFPMEQRSLSEAILMPMGKGFAVTSNLDLAGHLMAGYAKHRAPDMPHIRIAAIANDAVATLVSFVYQYPAKAHQKAVMGLIVGTGCNATLPLKLSSLHHSKRPASISILPGQEVEDVKIAVNTEWTIRGTAPPLRKLGLISRWDTELDQAGEVPGFQPLEYMTAGRYLGELARLIFVDYYRTVLILPAEALPSKLHQRFGLSTTFLSHLYPDSTKGPMLLQVEQEFPPEDPSFCWTTELAHILYRIARAIELRAAGIIAASTVGLLRLAEEIPPPDTEKTELAVGYTGGCIQHFHSYLTDTQRFIDEILSLEFSGQSPAKVVLAPCHDGGITGAGILAQTTELAHPGALPGPEPTPTASRSSLSRRRFQDDDGSNSSENEDIDPNKLELMLSRSVQSAAPLLEPEAIEHSMLRNTRVRSRSRSRRRASTVSPYRNRRQSSTPRAGAEPLGGETIPDEETPLLPTPIEEVDETADADNNNPYLGGVSVTRFWLLFSQIMAGYFIACFDSTIMASSHPVITSYFGSSNSASWLSTAFLLTSTSFQPVLGSLSDAVGRKGPYVVTIAVFLVATVWCALAGSMTSFIVARSVCGLGAGGIMTLGSIIVPVVVACLIIAILVVPGDLGLGGKKKQTLREAMRTFDFKGSILMSTSVTFLILGLPIMPLHLVLRSPHMNLLFSNHIAAFLSNATLFNVPLFFQGVLLTTATTSGFRLVVSSAVASIAGTATGFLITYTRRLKWPLVLGTSLLLVGSLCLSSMQRGWPALLYILCLCPGAAGSGFQFPGTFMAILSVSEQREQAVVTSTLILWRSLGQVLGVACSSLVVQNALWYYLEVFVTGPEKDGVVKRVRQSVEAIRELPGSYREQVVQSYEAALRVTFLCCSVVALVSVLLIVPVRLPRLGKR